jgi:hypothetical protein
MTDDTPLSFDLPSVRRKRNSPSILPTATNHLMAACCFCGRRGRKHGVACGSPKQCRIAAIRTSACDVRDGDVACFGDACGHEDAIDLDRLRHDPLMKLAVGRWLPIRHELQPMRVWVVAYVGLAYCGREGWRSEVW